MYILSIFCVCFDIQFTRQAYRVISHVSAENIFLNVGYVRLCFGPATPKDYQKSGTD